MLEKLRELGIRDDLIDEIKKFRESYPAEKSYEARIPKLEQFYYGKDVWEQAITAILCGQNLLLVGHKATGKNLFAENLAGVFMRPRWDVSFHVNMDAVATEKSGRNKKICRGMFWEEYLFARIPGKNRTKIVCGKS